MRVSSLVLVLLGWNGSYNWVGKFLRQTRKVSKGCHRSHKRFVYSFLLTQLVALVPTGAEEMTSSRLRGVVSSTDAQQRQHDRNLQLPQRPPFRIVQLGDSFSAGNGARNQDGGRNYHSVEGCYRSPTNWGSQFAQSLGDVFAVTYINRACSGGVIADITQERAMGRVANCRFCGCRDKTAAHPEEEILRTENRNCFRYLRPQINAVDSSVDLVLLT